MTEIENEKYTIDLHPTVIKEPQKQKKYILIISTVFLCIVAITVILILYVRSNDTKIDNGTTSVSPTTSAMTSTAPTSTTIPKIKILNPLNGLEIPDYLAHTLIHRPLAITMDNSVAGRLVQENINRADIVYEALVEGGGTRFLGIYYSDQSNFRSMPVRSIRTVFLDNIAEYNDILLYHVGGAETPGKAETNAIQEIIDNKVKSLYYLNGNKWKLFNEIYDPNCTKKGNIPSWSCKYQTTEALWNKATEVGYETIPWEKDKLFQWGWKFDNTNFTQSNNIANTIKYRFTPIVNFDAEWTYDPATHRYLRKTAGKVHIDNASNTQVWTNILIIQKAKTKLNVDDKQRSIITTIGTGNAVIFMNGKSYDVIWKKDCLTCRTRYYTPNDNSEFVFQPGRVWISINREEEKTTIS